MLLTYIDGLSDMTEKGNNVSIIFVGDINFDGCVKYYVNHGFNTYNDTLAEVADVIREADIAVGNLECSLTTKSMTSKGIMKHKILVDADPSSVKALNFAGFDIMSVANNHFNDYGVKPVNLTIDSLVKVGIESFGFNFGDVYTPQMPIILTVENITVGFLAYCYVIFSYRGEYCSRLRKRFNLNAGPVSFTDEVATRDVQKLKEKVDVIIVYMHWGKDYKTALQEYQKRIANYLHSLGVSAVIGAHPHVLQSHVKRNYQLTVYSLGNFLFPQHGTKMNIFRTGHSHQLTKDAIDEFERDAATLKGPTTLSRILRMYVTRNGVIAADYLPVEIKFDREKKLLHPTLSNGRRWIEVCSKDDNACLPSANVKEHEDT
ncbi:capsule biosynthesis protein CapA-like [Xenia sp. Carnegie-2017]|uniref:capsule biosynthesis protein CapA-like n=1 Tax=Xenia sp. Carnegie-2017 TaxID=2897299 RepID=UPI001F036286|nr:capsule biosynthesis protein CapA-like [Xenia sp. Carnegie-2017]